MEQQFSQQSTQNTTSNPGAESEIKQFLRKFEDAFRSGNIDEILKFYSPDVVAFDMVPPLQIKGVDTYSKAWKEAASMMSPPWIFEPRDEKIYVDGNVAFAHHLANCGATSKEGKVESGWIRHTVGLVKKGGQWQIVNDHYSVPVDMKSGKSMMELKPEETTH